MRTVCPVCRHAPITPVKFSCSNCGLSVEGEFGVSPLARLKGEDARLAEKMILCGGNLKQLAEELGITYPTLRKRLDRLIEGLQRLQSEDEAKIDRLLSSMERGDMMPDQGLRLIKELKGES